MCLGQRVQNQIADISINIFVHTTDIGFKLFECDETAPTIPASHGDSTDPIRIRY